MWTKPGNEIEIDNIFTATAPNRTHANVSKACMHKIYVPLPMLKSKQTNKQTSKEIAIIKKHKKSWNNIIMSKIERESERNIVLSASLHEE